MVITRRAGIAFVVVALVLIFSGALDWGLDMAFYPWARATPPLLAEWTGPLTTGDGQRLIVSLEMHRARTARGTVCVKCNQIEGVAATCDPRGTVLRYRVFGSPANRDGRELRLGAKPEREPPPDGLELNELFGTWDGGDVLTLQADFVWRRGTSAISSTNDPATQPVPLRMRRDAAKGFETMCGRLAEPS
jgi:hypothetical protein